MKDFVGLGLVIATGKARPPSSAGAPDLTARPPDVTAIDCSGWLARPPPSSAGEPSDAPPGNDPKKMVGNTPEGIRYLMHHRPDELYKATKRLVELSHDKLGLQQGLVIATQRLEIVDDEGKHLCVAAATLAAFRLHKDGLSVELDRQALRALKPEFGGGDGATRKYWGDEAIATQAWIGDRAPEAWSKLQEALVDIISTARTAAGAPNS